MPESLDEVLCRTGAHFIVRGWLSANNIVFASDRAAPAVVIDTGYFSHGGQTLQLVDRALAGRSLDQIINTHLHSDHCGGNLALQERYPGVETRTPEAFRSAVAPWNEDELSFRDTGQHCPTFSVSGFIAAGEELALGRCKWQAHAAPGHDAGALMFFEPSERVLISGDALWEYRLAIIFPELVGESGFEAAYQTLDRIEQLQPRWVLPGHGGAFSDAASAIRRSRTRLDTYAATPQRHRDHAARALAMFHMLEHRTTSADRLQRWMVRTPVFIKALGKANTSGSPADERSLQAAAADVIASLIADGALCAQDGELRLVEA